MNTDFYRKDFGRIFSDGDTLFFDSAPEEEEEEPGLGVREPAPKPVPGRGGGIKLATPDVFPPVELIGAV